MSGGSLRNRAGIFLVAVVVSLSACASANANPGWQCATYARQIAPVSLRGNAWTWWQQAEGQYERGQIPKIGAVMVFKRTAMMPKGHVAVVRRVISPREVLVEQANWGSAEDGNRGQISAGDRVIDISAKNDWTNVRVWYAPVNDFGRANPVYGFIYPPSYDPRTGVQWNATEDMPGNPG